MVLARVALGSGPRTRRSVAFPANPAAGRGASGLLSGESCGISGRRRGAAPLQLAPAPAEWDEQQKAAQTRAACASLMFPDPLTVPAAPPIPRGRPDGAAARRVAVVWFRADLRLHDNHALATAFREASSVVPVYCFDPRDYGKSKTGFPKTGAYRAQFLMDCVSNLRERLRGIGSDLIIRVGRTEEVIAKLVRQTSASMVMCHSEVTVDEIGMQAKVDAAVQGEGAELQPLWGSTLYHKDDLPSKSVPATYAAFREMVKDVKIRKALESPHHGKGLPAGCDIERGSIPTLEDLGIKPETSRCKFTPHGMGIIGGEAEALRQMEAFLKEIGEFARKGKASGAKAGAAPSGASANFSCKISPWLALGCLSPRLLYEKVSAKAGNGGKAGTGGSPGRGGLSWLQFELMWRDFFRFTTSKHSAASSPVTTKATQASPALC